MIIICAYLDYHAYHPMRTAICAVSTCETITCRKQSAQVRESCDTAGGRGCTQRVGFSIRRTTVEKCNTTLSPIVGLRLGMNQHTEQLGNFLAEAAFQRSLDVVHARERQIVKHGAMQGKVKSPANALERQVMHVHDFGKA